MRHTRWFKDKVFYQIWPRSFRDGNGDGIGDLWGVLEKLDYLKELGIDGVWFSPLYPSPGADCGYDISDYMDIAPEYGGMEAFRAVLDGLHERGMKLVMDLVVNHTSDASVRMSSPLFQKRRACRTITCSRFSRASGFIITARTSMSICRNSAATCWKITTA